MKNIVAKLLRRKKLFITCVTAIVLGLGVAAYMIVGNATAGSATIDPPKTTLNAVLEKPIGRTVADLTPNENLYVAQGELMRAGSFETESSGATTSAGVEQKVYSKRVVKDGAVFKESVSCSSLVKVGEQRMAYGDCYVVRPSATINDLRDVAWSDSATRITRAAFEDRYGTAGGELSGYILNDDTIVSSVYDGYDEVAGLHSFTYMLDNTKATYYVLHEMRTNAGITKFPSFEKAVVTVTMDDEWKVRSFTTDCVYRVALFGGVSCTERLVETFSKIGEVEALPEYEFFSAYFDAEESESGIETEPDAINVLADLFAKPLANGKINAAIEINALGETLNADVSIGIDMQAEDILGSLVADVKLGDLYVRYDASGLYLSYGDLSVKTTINEIVGLVAAFTGGGEQTNSIAIDLDDLTSLIKLETNESGCVIAVPLTVGDTTIEATIYGEATDEGYDFTNAFVSVGDILTAEITLTDRETVTPNVDEAESLAPVFKAIKSGKFDFDADICGLTAEVTLDLGRGYIGVESGELTATIDKNGLIAKYGELAASLDFESLNSSGVIEKVTALLEAIDGKTEIDGLSEIIGVLGALTSGKLTESIKSFDFASIDVGEVVEIVRKITATAKESGCVIALDFGNIGVSVTLDETDGGYAFGSAAVEIEADGETKTFNLRAGGAGVEPLDVTNAVDLVALAESALPSVTSLIAADGCEISADELEIASDLGKIAVSGEAKIRGGNATAAVNVSLNDKRLLALDLTFSGGRLYADVNGIRFTADVSSLGAGLSTEALGGAITAIKGLSDELDEVFASAERLIKSFDLSRDITELSFGEALSVSLNLGDFGNAKARIRFGEGVTASISGLKVLGANISGTASVKPFSGEIAKPIGDYTTRASITIGNTPVALSFDLNAGVLCAQVGDEISIAADTEKVLVSGYGLKLKLAFDDLSSGEITAKIKSFVRALSIKGVSERTCEKIVSAIETVEGIFGGEATISKEDLADAIKNVGLNRSGDDYALSVSAFGASVSVDLAADEEEYSLGAITVSFGDKSIVATVAGDGEVIVPLEDSGEYVDLAALCSDALPLVESLAIASGYEIEISELTVAAGAHSFAVRGTARTDGENIYVNAAVKADGKPFVAAEIYVADGVLYGDIGGFKIAVKLGSGGGSVSAEELLASIKGYDDVVDGAIAAIEDLASSGVDFSTLIKSFAYRGGTLSAALDLPAIGTVNASVGFNDGVSVALGRTTVGEIAISLSASVKPFSGEISKPSGDYVTRLTVNIDEKNSAFVALDVINGIYRVKITDPDGAEDGLGVSYANDALWISYGDAVVRGDIARIESIIDDVIEVAREQFGDKLQSVDFDAFKNFDVKALIRSITLDASEAVELRVKPFGLDVRVCGGDDGSLSAKLVLTKTRAETNENGTETVEEYVYETIELIAGDGGCAYANPETATTTVDIATVFDEYFDVMTSLVKTNGWQFTLDCEIASGGSSYKIEGAVVDFVYYGKDEFHLRVRATVQTLVSGAYTESAYIELAYVNERLYVTYDDYAVRDSALRVSLSKQAIQSVVADVLPELREVIPQLDEIIVEAKRAMTEAVGSSESVSLSSVLKDVSYVDGKLSVTADGSVFVGRLGDISLSVSRDGENGLKAELGELCYYVDDAHTAETFAVRSLCATARAVTVAPDSSDEQTKRESVAAAVGSYNDEDYIGLDSVTALARSFVKTARADEDGNRTFTLQGDIPVKLTALKIIDVDVTLKLDCRIDVKKNAEGKDVTFVAVKLSRGNLDGKTAAVAFADKGGDGYLYYDGEKNLITIKRNSYNEHTYCSKCKSWSCGNGWHLVYRKDYVKLDNDPEIGDGKCGYEVTLTPAEFSADIIGYVLEIINFTDAINNEIIKAIDGNTSVYGVDDVILDYAYADSAYEVKVTLIPIDDVLGDATVKIAHDEDYALNGLTGSIRLLNITGVTCDGTFDIKLVSAPYGDGEAFAKNLSVW